MTMSEAQSLFGKGSYTEAMDALRNEASRNGWEATQVLNAGTMQLMLMATKTPDGSPSGSVSSNRSASAVAVSGHSNGVMGSGGHCNGEGDEGDGEGEGAGNGSGDGDGGTQSQSQSQSQSQGESGDEGGQSQGGDGEEDGEGEGGGESPSQSQDDGEGNGEEQSQQPQDGKRKRNTPSWKSIAEEEKKKAEELRQKMREDMAKAKEEFNKRLEEEQLKHSEPSSAEEAEKKAEELFRKAQQMRDEARRKAEEEAKAKSMAKSKMFHKLTNEVLRRSKRLHNEGAVVYLEGPAGSGKSTLAMDLCRRLFGFETRKDVLAGDKFAFISLTADTLTSNIIGGEDVNRIYHESNIVRVFREGGVILFDEVDAADPNILAGLNAMVANEAVQTPNGIVTKHPDTHIIWAGNTLGTGANSMYTARNRLDAATLDRGKMGTIHVDYDSDMERSMCEVRNLPPAEVEWISNVTFAIRKAIADNNWRVLCSTRFVQQSCALLIDIDDEESPAYTHDEILDIFMIGLSDDQKRRLNEALRYL